MTQEEIQKLGEVLGLLEKSVKAGNEATELVNDLLYPKGEGVENV